MNTYTEDLIVLAEPGKEFIMPNGSKISNLLHLYHLVARYGYEYFKDVNLEDIYKWVNDVFDAPILADALRQAEKDVTKVISILYTALTLDFTRQMASSIFGIDYLAYHKVNFDLFFPVPKGKEFILPDGERVYCLAHMFNVINKDFEKYKDTVNPNDIVKWVRDIGGDNRLADALQSANKNLLIFQAILYTAISIDVNGQMNASILGNKFLRE